MKKNKKSNLKNIQRFNCMYNIQEKCMNEKCPFYLSMCEGSVRCHFYQVFSSGNVYVRGQIINRVFEISITINKFYLTDPIEVNNGWKFIYKSMTLAGTSVHIYLCL